MNIKSKGTVKKARLLGDGEEKIFDNFKKDIGTRLIMLRGAEALEKVSDRMLDEGISISKSTLQRYEIGKTLIDTYTLSQIAKFYNVSLEFLVYGEEIKPSEKIEHLLKGTTTEFQQFILDNVEHLINSSRVFLGGK